MRPCCETLPSQACLVNICGTLLLWSPRHSTAQFQNAPGAAGHPGHKMSRLLRPQAEAQTILRPCSQPLQSLPRRLQTFAILCWGKAAAAAVRNLSLSRLSRHETRFERRLKLRFLTAAAAVFCPIAAVGTQRIAKVCSLLGRNCSFEPI